MELANDPRPPKPDRMAIRPPEDPDETPLDSSESKSGPGSPGSNTLVGVSDEVFKKLHKDIQKNHQKIQSILLKHLKVPLWESSSDQVTIRCNFQHTYNLSTKDILALRVRCPSCKNKIDEISLHLYENIDGKLFKIIRINRFGQVVLRCVNKNHKIRVAYNITQKDNDVPNYCPECIVDISSPSNSKENSDDEMNLAERLQDINIARGLGEGSESDTIQDEWEEFFGMDSYLHGNNSPISDCYSNPDFDLFGDKTGYAISDIESNHDGCCDSDYESYFDSIDVSSPILSSPAVIPHDEPQHLNELVQIGDHPGVDPEMNTFYINHILTTVVNKNISRYESCKKEAISKHNSK